MSPCGAFFPGDFDEIFMEVQQFYKRPPTYSCKTSEFAPGLTHYSFFKTLHVKCLTVF